MGRDARAFAVGWSCRLPDGTGRSRDVDVAEDGSFVLTDVPPRTVLLYTLHVADERCAVLRVDARVDRVHVLTLEPGLCIEGWVRAPPAGGGGWLTIRDPHAAVRREARVEPDGHFRTEGLPPGRYGLGLGDTVLVPDVAAGTEDVVVTAPSR